jgi:hypothetical protein
MPQSRGPWDKLQLNATYFPGMEALVGRRFRLRAGQKPGPQSGKPDPTARRYTLRQVQKGKVSGIELQLVSGGIRKGSGQAEAYPTWVQRLLPPETEALLFVDAAQIPLKSSGRAELKRHQICSRSSRNER